MLMSCLQVQQVLVNSVYSVVFIESHFRPPPEQNSWRGSPHQPATTSWGVRGSSVHWGMKTVPWLLVLHGPGYFRNCWSSFPTCKNITWSDSMIATEFGVNDVKAWIHPACDGVILWGTFFWETLGSSGTNVHCFNSTACLRVVAQHVYDQCTHDKTQIISTWYWRGVPNKFASESE